MMIKIQFSKMHIYFRIVMEYELLWLKNEVFVSDRVLLNMNLSSMISSEFIPNISSYKQAAGEQIPKNI